MIKKPSDSAVNDQVFPIFYTDLNFRGDLFGGRAMEMVDKAASYVAIKHNNCLFFTKSCHVEFFSPVKLGELLIFKSSVNRVWNASMEVGVKAFARSPIFEGNRHVLSGYVTFITVDETTNKPIPVPHKLKPVTREEKRRHKEAEQRRQFGFWKKRP